jgi:hypothetical protein
MVLGPTAMAGTKAKPGAGKSEISPALAQIQNFEVAAFTPHFSTTPQFPPPELYEYVRAGMQQSGAFSLGSPADGRLNLNCQGLACRTVVASIVGPTGTVWEYPQQAYWFFDMPKDLKRMARNVVRQLETDRKKSLAYQAAQQPQDGQDSTAPLEKKSNSSGGH